MGGRREGQRGLGEKEGRKRERKEESRKDRRLTDGINQTCARHYKFSYFLSLCFLLLYSVLSSEKWEMANSNLALGLVLCPPWWGVRGLQITVKKEWGLSSPVCSSTPGTEGKAPVDIPFGLGAGANHSQPLSSPSPISGVPMCSALCPSSGLADRRPGEDGGFAGLRGTAWIHTGHCPSWEQRMWEITPRWRTPPEPPASPSCPCRADPWERAEAATGQQKLVADVQTQSWEAEGRWWGWGWGARVALCRGSGESPTSWRVASERKGERSAGEKEAWRARVPAEGRANGRHPRTEACLLKQCSVAPVEWDVGRRSTSHLCENARAVTALGAAELELS